MRGHRSITVVLLVFAGAASLVANPKSQESGKPKAPTTQVSDSAEGARLLKIHCGRCHTPPDDIPPAVAGTVLRHMRVRANLSKEEEQQILRYIRP
jgi:mono/diheme cytochrome c family protein